MNVFEVRGYISSSEDIDELRDLNSLIVQRIKILRKKENKSKIKQLKPGDRVSFDESECDYIGEVVETKRTRVHIKVLKVDGAGRFSTGEIVIVPAALLDPIEG